MGNSLLQPSRLHTDTGETRRVGVEIELSGLSFDTLVSHVADFFSASAAEESRYVHAVKSDYGTFKVELDSDPVKDFEVNTDALPEALADVADAALEWMDATAEKIVPLEIVGPPMAFTDLDDIEKLCVYLRDLGAKGSRHALHYAFGLQLNPELPSLDAATILGYMRAFSLSYEWLKARQQIDISRKFTTYIGPWPDDYVQQINDSGYQPDIDQLIADYIHHNPTRNRALDMMPLFAHLRGDLIEKKIGDPRIKARPTLHYRLPDCDIDNPEWSFAHVWNDWVLIDELAADQDRMAAMADAWRAHQRRDLDKLLSSWEKESAQWLMSTTDH